MSRKSRVACAAIERPQVALRAEVHQTEHRAHQGGHEHTPDPPLKVDEPERYAVQQRGDPQRALVAAEDAAETVDHHASVDEFFHEAARDHRPGGYDQEHLEIAFDLRVATEVRRGEFEERRQERHDRRLRDHVREQDQKSPQRDEPPSPPWVFSNQSRRQFVRATASRVRRR